MRKKDRKLSDLLEIISDRKGRAANGVKININERTIQRKIENATEKAMWEISSEVMADCNEFAKEDTGTLINSSMVKSEPGKGKIVWDTPYAKRQYWAVKTAHKQPNPNATWKWCEFAKKKWGKKWAEKAQQAFNKHF